MFLKGAPGPQIRHPCLLLSMRVAFIDRVYLIVGKNDLDAPLGVNGQAKEGREEGFQRCTRSASQYFSPPPFSLLVPCARWLKGLFPFSSSRISV